LWEKEERKDALYGEGKPGRLDVFPRAAEPKRMEEEDG